MRLYFYRALTPEGTTVRGLIAGEDEREVRELLGAKGLYPYGLVEVPSLVGFPLRGLFRPRVDRQEFIDFARNMSLMIRSGIPVISALESLSENVRTRSLKNSLSEVTDLVKRGLRLSDALQLHRDIFPPIFPNLVRVGEEAGNLDKVFQDIADHLQRIQELVAAIQRALLYPIFALVASMGAIFFWLIYVLPKVASSMRDMGVELPPITLLMVTFGELLSRFFWTIPLVVFALFVLHQLIKDRPSIKKIRDRLLLKLPVLRTIILLRSLSIFCEQMRILLEAGISIDTALQRAADAVGNEVMREAILGAKERILLGERVSKALLQAGIFPSMLIKFVDVGETTGRLGEEFGFLSGHYIERLQDYSARLGKIVEPVVISVLGMFFALVMVSLFLPVYDMISRIGMG